MAKMKAKTAVERCKEKYPGMTQAVYSMARNPEKYGIRFTPEARYLAGFPSTKEIDKGRAKPHRLVCRVSDRVWAALQEIAGTKYIPMQAMVEEAVLHYYDLEMDEKWNS